MNYQPKIPTILAPGAIRYLGGEVRLLGVKRPLCVYGQGTKKAGIAEKAQASLLAAGFDICAYDSVNPDPSTDDVDSIAAAAAQWGADCLIGIGGGSNMDAAKAAAIALELGLPAADIFTMPPKMHKVSLPVVLVPTTAGSGSEASNACVITNARLGRKVPAKMESALAIVDPELMTSLPAGATALTGLDAFTHAAEAILSVHWSQPLEKMCLAAIGQITENLPLACADGGNIEARTAMAAACGWAGLATVDSPPNAGHGLGDALSAGKPLPHGLVCAWAMPEVLELTARLLPGRVRRIGEAMGAEIAGDAASGDIGRAAAGAFRDLMRRLNIPAPEQAGASREEALRHAADALPLCADSPVEITEETVRTLISGVFDNYACP